jgi:hypothetical protein
MTQSRKSRYRPSRISHRRYAARIAGLGAKIGRLQALVLESPMRDIQRPDTETEGNTDAALARKDALIATLLEQRWLLMDERRTLRREVNTLERLLRAHHILFYPPGSWCRCGRTLGIDRDRQTCSSPTAPTTTRRREARGGRGVLSSSHHPLCDLVVASPAM